MAIGLQTEFAKEGPGMEKYGFIFFFKGKKRYSYDKQAMWTDFLAQWRGKRGGSVGP